MRGCCAGSAGRSRSGCSARRSSIVRARDVRRVAHADDAARAARARGNRAAEHPAGREVAGAEPARTSSTRSTGSRASGSRSATRSSCSGPRRRCRGSSPEHPEWKRDLTSMAHGSHTPILFGTLDIVWHGPGDYDYYNAAMLADSTGVINAQEPYRKSFLVPIVERVPFVNPRWFAQPQVLRRLRARDEHQAVPALVRQGGSAHLLRVDLSAAVARVPARGRGHDRQHHERRVVREVARRLPARGASGAARDREPRGHRARRQHRASRATSTRSASSTARPSSRCPRRRSTTRRPRA